MEEIYKLWDRFDASSATEMRLETAEYSFFLKKGGEQTQDGDRTYGAPLSVSQGKNDADYAKKYEKSTGKTAAVANENKAETAVAGKFVEVKSPLAGIFYRASSPEAEVFVKPGSAVTKGAVLGIVEAMKMMNEILAPIDGVVEDIPAQDSEMVEYDQVLFKLKES